MFQEFCAAYPPRYDREELRGLSGEEAKRQQARFAELQALYFDSTLRAFQSRLKNAGAVIWLVRDNEAPRVFTADLLTFIEPRFAWEGVVLFRPATVVLPALAGLEGSSMFVPNDDAKAVRRTWPRVGRHLPLDPLRIPDMPWFPGEVLFPQRHSLKPLPKRRDLAAAFDRAFPSGKGDKSWSQVAVALEAELGVVTGDAVRVAVARSQKGAG